MRLYLDFETRSELDIAEVGGANYVAHPSTLPLMIAYAFDEEPVTLHDLTVDLNLPQPVRTAIECSNVQKIAWNAAFEVAVLDQKYGCSIDLRHWLDPMILARHLTFPGSLSGATDALKLTVAKDKRGKNLIKLFSIRQQATAKQRKAGHPESFWADRASHPELWAEFCEYACTDVASMREALAVMESYTPLPPREHLLWRLDFAVNDRGLPVDRNYVERASAMMDASDAETLITLGRVTGCNNPNSVAQLKSWLAEQGCPMASVAAGAVIEALEGELPPEVRQALLARQQLGGAGPKKLAAIQALTSGDGRLRNQFVFCGARTGRWTSRGVQVQNLPRGSQLASQHTEGLTDAIRTGIPLPIPIDVVDAVTSTIRSAFRTQPGHRFLICDYASIENRVLAWVAACEPMQRVFRDGKDPYKDFATRLFSKSYEDVSKQERTLSKPAVLGSGYGALGTRLAEYPKSMGMELSVEEATTHVQVFRDVYPEVPALWSAFGRLAVNAVRDRCHYSHFSGVAFDGRDPRFLSVRLPSDRKLYYLAPRMEIKETPAGPREALHFDCARSRGFARDSTYGAKLVENVVQAIARDILTDGLYRTVQNGFEVVGHVHDEIIVEEPDGGRKVRVLESFMAQAPVWASGLALSASGFESPYYKKD